MLDSRADCECFAVRRLKPLEAAEAIETARFASEWFKVGKLELYLRRRPLLTIANMRTTDGVMGRGLLTAFLDEVEPHYNVYIENVINPRLNGYFLRRGYELIEQPYAFQPPCYEKVLR